MSDDPDGRRYAPWVIFFLVLALFAWALAVRNLGAR